MMKRLLLAGVFAAVCPLLQGAATYDTYGFSSFSIGGPRSVVVGSAVDRRASQAIGFAAYDAEYSVDGVFPATLRVEVSGSADAPPTSTATSTYASGHIFGIANEGEVPITVGFGLSYSWFVSVIVDDPSLEGATGGVFFHITRADGGTLSIGPGGLTEWVFNPTASTTLGQTGTSGSGAIGGTITVPAFTLATFSVITDTTGFAHSQVPDVPEPGTWMMGGFGAAVLCFVRRQRSMR